MVTVLDVSHYTWQWGHSTCASGRFVGMGMVGLVWVALGADHTTVEMTATAAVMARVHDHTTKS